jgi:hypothetical protein
MDINGNWKLQPTLLYLHYFKEGLAVAVNAREKFGYIDHDGNWVVEPQFDDAYGFDNGIAKVLFNHKVGYIDKKGAWVIKPTFKHIGDFKDGMALAEIFVDDMYHRRMGFINRKGAWIIPPDYRDLSDFNDDEWIFATKYDPKHPRGEGQLGYLDRKGRFFTQKPEPKVLPKTQIYQETSYPEGSADSEPEEVEEMIEWGDDRTGKVGIKDPSGKWLISPQFEAVSIFAEKGIFRACKGGKWGIMNKKGTWIVRPQYEHEEFVSEFYDGVAMITTNEGKVGFINLKGKWVIKPKYDRLAFVRFINEP